MNRFPELFVTIDDSFFVATSFSSEMEHEKSVGGSAMTEVHGTMSVWSPDTVVDRFIDPSKASTIHVYDRIRDRVLTFCDAVVTKRTTLSDTADVLEFSSPMIDRYDR